MKTAKLFGGSLSLPWACSAWGASMGRRDTLPDNPSQAVKLRLRRLPMVDGCYDAGGAYWGKWSPTSGGMWAAWADGVRVFVRALSRREAAEKVRRVVPGARFHGVTS